MDRKRAGPSDQNGRLPAGLRDFSSKVAAARLRQNPTHVVAGIVAPGTPVVWLSRQTSLPHLFPAYFSLRMANLQLCCGDCYDGDQMKTTSERTDGG